MRKKLPSIILQVLSTLLVLLSAMGCASPKYIYVEPEAITVPTVAEFVDEVTYELVHTVPDIIEEPETVADLIHNISAYRDFAYISQVYAYALEDYIDAVSEAVSSYGVEL